MSRIEGNDWGQRGKKKNNTFLIMSCDFTIAGKEQFYHEKKSVLFGRRSVIFWKML